MNTQAHLRPADIHRALDASIDVYDQRFYLGMSRIGDCPRSLYRMVTRGSPEPGMTSQRYCHEGLLHEADVVDRLNASGLTIVCQQREIRASFDDRFLGHIDGEFEDGTLIEIKSVSDVARLDRIRANGAMPNHVWQVQAYMRYGEYELTYLIYKARVNGGIWVVPLRVDTAIGQRIERKAQAILAAVDGKANMPNCSCGRCNRQAHLSRTASAGNERGRAKNIASQTRTKAANE